MVTKEELSNMSKEEVYRLFKEKKRQCKTIAQEIEMIYSDSEYQMIKERLEGFYEK